jgi:hypothetical protein
VLSAALCRSSIVVCRCLRSDALSGIAVGFERIIMYIYIYISLMKTKTRRTRCAHILGSGIKFKRSGTRLRDLSLGKQATVPSESDAWGITATAYLQSVPVAAPLL